MNTISPGLEEVIEPRITFDLKWLSLSPGWWAGIAMALLFGGVAAWRLAICFSSVLACSR
jgi:hypothetical protein